MLRYPKYINLIKKKFGDESEMMVEEILQQSYSTASKIILKVMDRMKNDHKRSVSLIKLREIFLSLITAQYLIRLPYADDEKPVPNLILHEKDQFVHPNIDIKSIALFQNKEIDALPDDGIYFTANFDRFHQDMRDKLIVNNFTKKFDENVGEFVRLLLQQMYIRTNPWQASSNPVPLTEIKDIVRKQGVHNYLLAFFDQYAQVLGLFKLELGFPYLLILKNRDIW